MSTARRQAKELRNIIFPVLFIFWLIYVDWGEVEGRTTNERLWYGWGCLATYIYIYIHMCVMYMYTYVYIYIYIYTFNFLMFPRALNLWGRGERSADKCIRAIMRLRLRLACLHWRAHSLRLV
jgi:hypothetical protein